MASSGAMPFLKPNCFPTSNLLVLKCSVSLIYKFSFFHTVVLLSLIFIMTVTHNYLFINL